MNKNKNDHRFHLKSDTKSFQNLICISTWSKITCFILLKLGSIRQMQVRSGKFMNSQNFYSIILTQVSRNVHHVLL